MRRKKQKQLELPFGLEKWADLSHLRQLHVPRNLENESAHVLTQLCLWLFFSKYSLRNDIE